MKYYVSKNTAKLLNAVNELVKANNRICCMLSDAKINDNESCEYDRAIQTARTELIKLISNAIERKFLEERKAVRII